LATHRSQSRAGEQSGRGCFVKIACGRSRGPSPALAALRTREEEERALRLVISRFEDFAQAVATGLAEADLERKRMILHALVKRVEIDDEVIRVVFRVSPPHPSGHDPPGLHDWENLATEARDVDEHEVEETIGVAPSDRPC
jgi:hypothetical protein